jgi:hypothetical protein
MKTKQFNSTIEKSIVVDLTSLLPHIGKLLEGNKTELKLIEFYRYLHTEENSPLTNFNKYMLSHFYIDKNAKSSTEIYFYINSKIYINTVMNFLDKIYIILLDYVNPEFIDVVFDKFIENTDEKLVVQFTVVYPERIKKWLR